CIYTLALHDALPICLSRPEGLRIMDFAAARKVMLDSQVRVNDVTDRQLHAAIGAVERERFCAADRAFSAYADVEPEIAGGRRLRSEEHTSELQSREK